MLGARLLARRSLSGASGAVKYDYDVLIVGGGIVGSLLACALARNTSQTGLRVALVEAARPASLAQVMGSGRVDPRCYAMAPSSMDFLQANCAHIPVDEFRSYSQMHVWEASSNAFLRFSASEMKEERLGYICENSILQAALFETMGELAAAGQLDLKMPSMLQRLERVGPGAPADQALRAELCPVGEDAKAESVSARLVVAADGSNSNVRRLLGLSGWGFGYQQRAVVCSLEWDAAGAAAETAYQRYLPSGPIALLPQKGGLCSLVWSTSPAEADALRAMSEEDFVHTLNSKLQSAPDAAGAGAAEPPLSGLPRLLSLPQRLAGRALSEMDSVADPIVASSALNASTEGAAVAPRITGVATQRFAFDLRQEQAWRYAHPRVALVGDAAHTIHPMAGQGLNLGVADAKKLAEEIERGAASGSDIGSNGPGSALLAYEGARAAAAAGMGGSLAMLHLVFSASQNPLLRVARKGGMGAINMAAPIKEQLARVAMGV